MAELSIDPSYLRHLIVKVRAFMGKEATDIPDDGSNPIDDPLPLPALQEEEDDLSREEVIEEIRGLEPQQQAELVALMWLGREDGEPEEWDELVKRAIERREVPTESYLLDHPLLAEHWLDGMERLGLGGLVGGGEQHIVDQRAAMSGRSGAAEVQARLFEFLPSPPLTIGQVDLLKVDSVASGALPGFPELGIQPKSIEEVIPTYIGK